MNNDLQSLFGGVPFDPNSVEPQTDFEVLPPGKYPVLIESAEVKQTRAGTGHYVELTMKILDGPAKNRKLWDRINLQNPNVQCEEIGRRTLSALGRALGLASITDTAQLVNGVVVAHVKVKDDQNNVRTYSSPSVTAPASVQAPVTAPAAPVAAPATLTYQQPVAAPQPTVAPVQAPQPVAAPQLAVVLPVASTTSPASVAAPQTPIVPGSQQQTPQQPARPWDRK